MLPSSYYPAWLHKTRAQSCPRLENREFLVYDSVALINMISQPQMMYRNPWRFIHRDGKPLTSLITQNVYGMKTDFMTLPRQQKDSVDK